MKNNCDDCLHTLSNKVMVVRGYIDLIEASGDFLTYKEKLLNAVKELHNFPRKIFLEKITASDSTCS